VTAPLVSWLVAIANNRHDRWVKTYDDRRDTYMRLLSRLFAEQQTVIALMRALQDGDAAAARAKIPAQVEDPFTS
jgi:hypothetical protein